MTPLFSVALIHYPVYNKHREVVTTAVTNLDIHDIARSARTFGAERYYIVTPVEEQQKLAEKVTSHWQSGWGAGYNPKRKAALDIVSVVPTLADALKDMAARIGHTPKVVVTGAAAHNNSLSSGELSQLMQAADQGFMLLFGTGWGMTEELFAGADYVLEPIHGTGEYNHLSVRSAVSIYMDRLFGRR